MLKFGTQVDIPLSRTIPKSRMTHVLHVIGQEPSMSSKYLMMMGGSWHTSNHDRMLKFGTQVEIPMSRTITKSRMTHVLHVSGQEPSMSSKYLMMMGGSWHTFNHARMLKFGTQVEIPMSRTIPKSRMTHVLLVFGQEPSMSSKSLMMIGWFLTYF